MISAFILRYRSILLILFLTIVFPAGNALTLLSPNGGENLSTSTTQLIQWRVAARITNFVKLYFLSNVLVLHLVIPDIVHYRYQVSARLNPWHLPI